MQADLKVLDLMRRPKVTATIPEDVYEFLSEWAEREQRPLSNLVAYVLSTAVRDIQQRQMERQQGNGALTSAKVKPQNKPSKNNSPSPSKSEGK